MIVTTCGGYVNTSSALIEYQPGASIRADQQCVWIVKVPLTFLRFRLVSSGLGENDGLFINDFLSYAPTTQKKLIVGENYTVSSDQAVITLSVGHAPTRGFSLEFFSSGMVTARGPYSGFASLNMNSGNFSYPSNGGQYRDGENAVFVVNPIVPAQRTLRFTRMGLEYANNCVYDAVSVYNWFNNEYIQLGRYCGTTLPPTFTLEAGVALVVFRSDTSNVGVGFAFEWL
ncbi:exoskeleton protein RP43-like [Folsomia candida]|uniref:exoskeleton protein RP43-like n=1 Tax=Folsomia candida TaxID=158441 RepID=UPI001604FCF6|nr:exoskeleton protein RP43-like [Folsomia candida]